MVPLSSATHMGTVKARPSYWTFEP